MEFVSEHYYAVGYWVCYFLLMVDVFLMYDKDREDDIFAAIVVGLIIALFWPLVLIVLSAKWAAALIKRWSR